MDQKVVFTPWNVTLVIDDYKSFVHDTAEYLKNMEKEFKEGSVNVYFLSQKKMFIIENDSVEYEVVLPPVEQKLLEERKTGPLVDKLFRYANKTYYRKEKENIEEVKEDKINAMKCLSSLDDVEVEDLEIYLDYLKSKLQKNKNDSNLETKVTTLSTLIKRKKEEGSKLEIKSEGSIRKITNYVKELLILANELNCNDKEMVLNRITEILDKFDSLDAKGREKVAPIMVKKLDVIKKLIEECAKKEKLLLEKDLNRIMGKLNGGKRYGK